MLCNIYPFIQQLSNSRVVTCTNAPLLVTQWGEILSEEALFIFMKLCFLKIFMIILLHPFGTKSKKMPIVLFTFLKSFKKKSRQDTFYIFFKKSVNKEIENSHLVFGQRLKWKKKLCKGAKISNSSRSLKRSPKRLYLRVKMLWSAQQIQNNDPIYKSLNENKYSLLLEKLLQNR